MMMDEAEGFSAGPAGYNMPGEEQSIMDMRWQSPELIWELWKALADMIPVRNEKGQIQLVRQHPQVKPPMNEAGALRVINLVRSYVNPVVALSNISEDDARSMWGHAIKRIVRVLHLHGHKYGLEGVEDVEWVIQYIKPLTFAQLMRAVKGHEAKQSRTQTQEVRHDTYNEQKTSGFWSKRRGING